MHIGIGKNIARSESCDIRDAGKIYSGKFSIIPGHTRKSGRYPAENRREVNTQDRPEQYRTAPFMGIRPPAFFVQYPFCKEPPTILNGVLRKKIKHIRIVLKVGALLKSKDAASNVPPLYISANDVHIPRKLIAVFSRCFSPPLLTRRLLHFRIRS